MKEAPNLGLLNKLAQYQSFSVSTVFGNSFVTAVYVAKQRERERERERERTRSVLARLDTF